MARRRSRRDWEWSGYGTYVPIAQRRALAARQAQRAKKNGEQLDPVSIQGRKIATTAWGLAWCAHIESFRDYENRLPRGRTYVRNGSVYHLEIGPGEIRARVMGSDDYEQRIEIEPCKPAVWSRVRRGCAGAIGSLIELLEGRISAQVMASMTAEKDGLLPDLKHVRMGCSCPDWAWLCKHLAAVLYGVGARLDERPELLFALRGVDPAELVDNVALPTRHSRASSGIEGDLSSVFGIELELDEPAPPERKTTRRRARKATKKRAAPRAPRPARKVSRRELLEAGVPPGTIATWLRQGVLEHSDERGVYRHTRDSRERLERYGA